MTEQNFFKQLHQSNIKYSKSTVYGYMKEYESTLFQNVSHKTPYHNIPQIVMDICLIYYHLRDKWDIKHIGHYHKLKASIIKHETPYRYCSWTSSFGQEIVETGNYNWKFRLNNITNTSEWGVSIGIWNVNSNINRSPPTKTFFTEEGNSKHHTGYAYLTNAAKLVNANGDDNGDNYGIKCKTGDIIDMYLDLHALTLQYYVSGQDMGIACHNIQHAAYRAAVMTCGHNYEIEML